MEIYYHQSDSVTIVYRVFPYKLNSVVQRLSFDSVSYKFYAKPFEFGQNEQRTCKEGFLILVTFNTMEVLVAVFLLATARMPLLIQISILH